MTIAVEPNHDSSSDPGRDSSEEVVANGDAVRLFTDSVLNGIHQGDCVSRMSELPAESLQLVFADPPFNIGYEYDVYKDSLEREQYLAWSRSWMAQVHRVLDASGTFWLAIGDEYAAELKLIAQEVGFHCRSWVVWYYTFGVNCKSKFTRSHAHLFYFVKDPKRFTYNAADIAVPSARQLVYADARANPKGRNPDDTWILRPQDCTEGLTPNEDVWYFPRVAGTFKERAGFHGCQMPEQLLGRIIRVSSNPSDIVMDPFSGSASTLVVAKKLGRHFLGFDLSNEYVQLGTDRLSRVLIGETLEGAPEPKVSAPATKDGKQRLDDGAGRRTRRKNMTGLASPMLPFPDELMSEGEQLLRAFQESNRGASPDRVIVDPVLNEAFHKACDAMEIPGSKSERNRFLLRLRKFGKLMGTEISREQVTVPRWSELDRYLHASEIAWRRVADAYLADLDEILCEPRLTEQFDCIAADHAPGRNPLEYRWGALLLRRALGGEKESIALPSTDEGESIDWERVEAISADRLELESVTDSSALYSIGTIDAGGSGRRYLFVGETLNLRERLRVQFESAKNATCEGLPTRRFVVQFKPLGELNTLTQQYRCRLVETLRPEWNLLSAS
ncbi:MAG: site-specific DNA-methyltransferase [Planctomycetes bacterium]|nr:site-specific DNA-methyltransferase [Planctomycetota bacterium]